MSNYRNWSNLLRKKGKLQLALEEFEAAKMPFSKLSIQNSWRKMGSFHKKGIQIKTNRLKENQ